MPWGQPGGNRRASSVETLPFLCAANGSEHWCFNLQQGRLDDIPLLLYVFSRVKPQEEACNWPCLEQMVL